MSSYRPAISPKAHARLAYMAAERQISITELIDELADLAWSQTANVEKGKAPAAIGKEPEKRKKGTFSPEEIDQIKTLYREGMSIGKIAARLGRHKSAVSYAIRAMKKRGEI